MTINTCRFCNYTTDSNFRYYCHLYLHIDFDTIELFTMEELKKANQCMDNKIKYSTKYIENNKEKIKESSKVATKKYRETHREIRNEKNRKFLERYREENKEKIIQYRTEYYHKNKEKINQRKRYLRGEKAKAKLNNKLK